MSHFTTIRTRLAEKAPLLAALKDLGYAFEEGDLTIRGFAGTRTNVEIRVHGRASGLGGIGEGFQRMFSLVGIRFPGSAVGYGVGFRKAGPTYELVADWDGVRGIQRDRFVQQLTQRYAYHAACQKLAEQGFTVASEETQKDGRIHLVLRRAV